MKKIINQPQNFVKETIEGIIAAYPNFYATAPGEQRALVKKDIKDGKVAIVTGGGSGHLPLFLGYVGEGLADGCAIGNVFASPSAKVMLDVTTTVDRGKGVLYLFGNYGGDKMNFEMAAELAENLGIETKTLLCNDDVASAPVENAEKRRGVAGIFFAYKIAGAAAEKMLPLEEVYRIVEKANRNIKSMGVAISSCTLPEVGSPSFDIAEDEMEIGMGIHGEPGIHRGKMKTADEVAKAITTNVLPELKLEEGSEVAVLVNGLGSTPREEMFIVFRKVSELLAENKISIFKAFVGEYATSFEMGGLSVSFMKLDDELKELLDAPAYSPLLDTWR